MDWYFDFVSPFSYVQLERMPKWPGGAQLHAKPVLLAALLNHWETKGPAEVEPKRVFTYRYIQWLAEHEGLPMRFPPRHPFNSVNTLRLAIVAGNDLEAIRTIFRFIWAEGGAVDTPEGWAELAKRVGIADADAKVANPEVKAALRRHGEEAIAAGVFGVPSLVIDGEIFWGVDATPMALDYLRDPQRFRSGEMQRIATIPVGASRK